jgi:hypothetical protein
MSVPRGRVAGGGHENEIRPRVARQDSLPQRRAVVRTGLAAGADVHDRRHPKLPGQTGYRVHGDDGIDFFQSAVVEGERGRGRDRVDDFRHNAAVYRFRRPAACIADLGAGVRRNVPVRACPRGETRLRFEQEAGIGVHDAYQNARRERTISSVRRFGPEYFRQRRPRTVTSARERQMQHARVAAGTLDFGWRHKRDGKAGVQQTAGAALRENAPDRFARLRQDGNKDLRRACLWDREAELPQLHRQLRRELWVASQRQCLPLPLGTRGRCTKGQSNARKKQSKKEKAMSHSLSSHQRGSVNRGLRTGRVGAES